LTALSDFEQATPAAFEFKQRHEGLRTPDYLFEIDEYVRQSGEQLLLAHIRVFRFTPHVYKEIKERFALLRKIVTLPLFAVPEQDTPGWRKFVGGLGFRPFKEAITTENGDIRPLFIHTTSLCM
jgi:hypothetical protein